MDERPRPETVFNRAKRDWWNRLRNPFWALVMVLMSAIASGPISQLPTGAGTTRQEAAFLVVVAALVGPVVVPMGIGLWSLMRASYLLLAEERAPNAARDFPDISIAYGSGIVPDQTDPPDRELGGYYFRLDKLRITNRESERRVSLGFELLTVESARITITPVRDSLVWMNPNPSGFDLEMEERLLKPPIDLGPGESTSGSMLFIIVFEATQPWHYELRVTDHVSDRSVRFPIDEGYPPLSPRP